MKSRSLEERILEYLRAARAWCDAGDVAIALDVGARDKKSHRNIAACMQRLAARDVLELNAIRSSVYFEHYRLARAKRKNTKRGGAKKPPAVSAPASCNRSISQRILDIMPPPPRALGRHEIAIAIDAERTGTTVAVVGSRIAKLVDRGFLKREGTQRSYRWLRTAKPVGDLAKPRPGDTFKITNKPSPKLAPTPAPVSIPVKTISPAPPPAPRPGSPSNETVEQFIARGGSVQVLPGFGWRAAELDRSFKGRTDARIRAGLEPRLAGGRRDTLDEQDAEQESEVLADI